VRQSQGEGVGRIERAGWVRQTQNGGDHPGDLALVGGAVADQRPFGRRGRELDHLGPEGGRAGEGDAAAFADPERRLHVPRRERALDDDDSGTKADQDLRDPRLDLAEAFGDRARPVRADRAGAEEARALGMIDDRPESDDEGARIDPQDDRAQGGAPARPRPAGDGTSPIAVRARGRDEPRGREHSRRELDAASGAPRRKGFLPHRAGPYALPARRERTLRPPQA
jgi:hypothetical protein